MSPHVISHAHRPIYRVVRASWQEPLDASFSQRAKDNRWNTSAFPALYCACSVPVARAVTRDILGFAGIDPSDLQPAYRPRLVQVNWSGRVVDVISAQGLRAADFPEDYPLDVDKTLTRAKATDWHAAGWEGVVCRSASLARVGFRSWSGTHPKWGEVAIFVRNAAEPPHVAGHQDDLSWLSGSGSPRG